MGIAAGYVDAVLSGVGVCNSQIVLPSVGPTPLTNNLSDFTLVGYCTDKAKTTLKVSTVTLTVPRTSTEEWVYEGDQGVENSWGGSVDMYSMFTRLQDIRIASTTNNNYVYDRYVEVGVNGQTNVLSESRATFYTNYTNPLMGSFVFFKQLTVYISARRHHNFRNQIFLWR